MYVLYTGCLLLSLHEELSLPRLGLFSNGAMGRGVVAELEHRAG